MGSVKVVNDSKGEPFEENTKISDSTTCKRVYVQGERWRKYFKIQDFSLTVQRLSGVAEATLESSISAISDVQESNPESNVGAASKVKQKRKLSDNVGNVYNLRKVIKRVAASSDSKDKSLDSLEESSFTETKTEVTVEHEAVALGLTAGMDDARPNRRLKDFILHDTEGNPQAVEMLEFNDLFISGLILPLEERSDRDKEKGVRCDGFGRVESWSISGYEEGSPIIWLSTDLADYDCVKPSTKYKKLYNLFFEKAHACVEVYKKLSRMHGGNPSISLDELIAGVVRAMSSSKNFPQGMPIKDFIISHGEFIYTQLVGLDATSKKNDQIFTGLPVLLAIRDEKKNFEDLSIQEATKACRVVNTNLKIDGDKKNQSSSSIALAEEDEDMKLARLLQEVENWLSFKPDKRQFSVPSSNLYIKINEDEIANDYPLPAYYKTCAEEIDEFLAIYDDGSIDLPENVLHNWALYNSDARLISLELLPMRPCADNDVAIFGSGTVTEDGDLSGHYLHVNSDMSSSGSAGLQDGIGLPIYLSAIKEWKIEFGSSMIFISLRTDLSWYRLGKPSKQYAPWYKPIVKTARLAISIITLLMEQSRVSRLSFVDVIQRLSKFDKGHHAFISYLVTEVERYVVVHGQIILQLFKEFPVKTIQNCPFVTGLHHKMQERHHTKLRVKEKRVLKKGLNLNPREAVATISTRKAMAATTTKLINRIWGDYYSNYLPEESNGADLLQIKEDDEVVEEQEESEEEDSEEVEELKMEVQKKTEKSQSTERPKEVQCFNQDVRWGGELLGKSCTGRALYSKAFVHRNEVAVGHFVQLETENGDQLSPIYFVEYMFENSGMRKMAHGRLLLYGSQTVLGNTANERELFLTNDCVDFELGDVKNNIVVEIKLISWGHQHRKASIIKDRNDKERAEERKSKGLPMEYYCKSLYLPEKGAFCCFPKDTMGLGNGVCHSCSMKEIQMKTEKFRLISPNNGFVHNGTEYCINDFVYLAPHYTADDMDHQTFKSGRNVGLRPYVVCQVLDVQVSKASLQPSPESTLVKMRKFFGPDEISMDKAYCSDIREVYYSEHIVRFPVMAIQGKCEVRKKNDIPSLDTLALFEHIFFCEHIYDPDKGTVKQLPAHVKLSSSKESIDDFMYRKKKGKCKEGENDFGNDDKMPEESSKNRLATLDIFAGCGGLSEGLERAGVSTTKWAIEYEEPAGEAFKQNHPEALVFINNCNVILRAIMAACGDADECISTSEASELAEKLDEKEIANLPRPGEVEFINGGPPCQGFSGMNRFNHTTWSKVQCEMILAFLSFADYFRPKFFLLENVRNFVSFNKGQTFRLALASLLEMGYQVRFGILEAGAFGVSQSRKRAFIWAACPEEVLPEWPEPMHVFAGPELKINLSKNSQYAAVRSTANGAPLRAITVRDTIGDLPAVGNGASLTTMEYKNEPVSWFQKTMRGDALVLSDHISKEMNELNLIRCKRIPKRPGADWRDLPDEKVKLSTGQLVDLVPWCLPNTAKRHNQWKGLFGRLDWEGNFPTSITDPQPMGKVGMCFHPEQDRILTVRECARSQGFPDSYKFAGNIQHKHRQIGNAVPPPLAFALGRKLKEAVDMKKSSY